jgi:hypothetical protein
MNYRKIMGTLKRNGHGKETWIYIGILLGRHSWIKVSKKPNVQRPKELFLVGVSPQSPTNVIDYR